MAQKKQPAVDPVRTKAAQMRQAQERADRRTRIIVISAVAAIVLAVVAAVGGVIWKQQAQVNAARNVDPSAIFGDYADGRPIILNSNGIVSEADPNLPTLTEYFDYSCHVCADLDAIMGEDLTTWAAEGHYNIELQPVITVGMDYQKAATGASLVVAQKAPDKWVDFHHALLAYFRTQFQASNGTVVQNLDASWKQIKQIAAGVGVPEDVIALPPQRRRELPPERYQRVGQRQLQRSRRDPWHPRADQGPLERHPTPRGSQPVASDGCRSIRYHRFREPGHHRYPGPRGHRALPERHRRRPEL